MLRSLRNLARLIVIGWTLARYDALVLAQMAGIAPGLLRLSRLRWSKPGPRSSGPSTSAQIGS